MSDQLYEFEKRHIPLPARSWDTDSVTMQIHVCLYDWFYWHQFIASVSDITVRLEQLDLAQLLVDLELAAPARAAELALHLKSVTKQKTHHWSSYFHLTWDVLYALDADVAGQTKALACRLGYDCDVPAPRVPRPLHSLRWRALPLVLATVVRSPNTQSINWLMHWIHFHLLTGVTHFCVFLHPNAEGGQPAVLKLLDDFQHTRKKGISVRLFVVANEPELQGVDLNNLEVALLEFLVQNNPYLGRWVALMPLHEVLFTPTPGHSTVEVIMSEEARQRYTHVVVATKPLLRGGEPILMASTTVLDVATVAAHVPPSRLLVNTMCTDHVVSVRPATMAARAECTPPAPGAVKNLIIHHYTKPSPGAAANATTTDASAQRFLPALRDILRNSDLEVRDMGGL